MNSGALLTLRLINSREVLFSNLLSGDKRFTNDKDCAEIKENLHNEVDPKQNVVSSFGFRNAFVIKLKKKAAGTDDPISDVLMIVQSFDVEVENTPVEV